MTAAEYIEQELRAGRLRYKHIQALTLYFQAGFAMMDARDGLPGPDTRKKLEEMLPDVFAPSGPQALVSLGRWLKLPLPLLPGKATPQARIPKVTSGFRPADRHDHNGLDFFYRWEVGDEPKFVGDGGCEGRLADGSPKWVVPYGISALSAAAGVVTVAGPSATGYRCWIDHGNGWRTGYFHLESLYVKSGQRVEGGTNLGLVGHNPSLKDGKPVADGRHLHFELSPVDKYAPVDPEPSLEKL